VRWGFSVRGGGDSVQRGGEGGWWEGQFIKFGKEDTSHIHGKI
jgi:hypothetical protein